MSRDVKVVLSAQVDGYKRAMRDAEQATDRLAKTTQKTGVGTSTVMDRARLSAERYDSRMQRLGQTSQIAGAAILTGLTVGLVKSGQAAANLEETVNKSNVLFGSASGQMQDWAAGAAQNLGLSKQAALDAASGFGDMFQQLGWAQDEAAGMSQSVVKLAADLGSFNNLPTAEVSEMISAGFRGEYDSLQRLIPNINAARVEKEALAMTGKSAAASLTAQEKAAATLAIITKDGARANDDFARTADSAANSQKIASAEFENAKASLGESLTPAMSKAAQVASTVFGAFNALPAPVKTLAIVITAAAGAFLFLAPKIAASKAMLSGWGVSAGAAGKSAGIATVKLMALAAAGAAITSALETKVSEGALASELEKFGRTGEIAGDAAKVFGDDMSKLQGDLSFMLTPNWYDSATKGVGKITGALGLFSTEGDISQQITKVDTALADLASRDPAAASSAFERIKSSAEAAGVPVADLASIFPSYTAAAASSDSGGSTPAAAGMESVADAAAAANGNVDEFAKKLEALIAPGMAASRAADEQKNALDGLASAAKANGTALEGNSSKARANRDAFRGAIQSNVDLATAYARLNGSVDEGKAKYDEASAALVRAGTRAGYSEKEIRKFIKSMNAASGTKATPKIGADSRELKQKEADALARLRKLNAQKPTPKVKAETEQAKRDLLVVQNQLAMLQDKTVTVTTVRKGPKGELGPAFATGGHVRGAGTKTSDSIPAWLSDGEYVIQAAAVDHYGPEFFDRVNARRFAGGGGVYRDQKSYDNAMKAWTKRDNAYRDQMSFRDQKISDRDSAVSSRTSRSESVRSSFRASSGVMGFDFGAAETARANSTAAIKDEADALDQLFEARRKANTASKADRPAALRELAEAQRKYADASRAAAEASQAEAAAKPTSANILQSFRDRVTKMQGFVGNLNTLAAWGMPKILLSEILNSGLESGSEMAAALVAGGPGVMGQFQSIAGLQTSLGNQLGAMDIDWTPNEGDQSMNQLVAAAQAAIPGAPKGPGKKPVLKKKKKRALGGPVAAGEPYLVGEQGAEMFVPGMSGAIVPNRQLANAVAVGGGYAGPSDVTFSGPVSINLDGNKVWQGLLTANRRTGFSLRPLDGS